jgi:thioester reductase-like protein
MEILKQLLASEKISIENLESEVQNLGFDPANLSDDDALKIVEKLKEKQKSKLSKNNKKQMATPLDNATNKAVQQTDAIVKQYQDLAEKVAEAKSLKILKIIEDIPNLTTNRVKELLESSGNLDFFLNPTENIQDDILSKFGIE